MDKGLGIHIKEKNKGKFTSYCKGLGYDSVTNECIAKGKKSKSSVVRKRSTFADNARKWN
ncbi:MAG: hypothetical protein RBU24_15375 [Kiritimatiellia bacterium]|jgi:hypothetical protein|nr:hypothetical protein [Kiritimatiellia bacterium]